MDQGLYDAARIGDVVALHSLLKEDPMMLDKICLAEFAETPLHVAALAGKTEFVKEIIRRMPFNFARELNKDGFAPMHVASARGDVDILMELLKLDDDRNLCLQRDDNGRIPLHYAVIRGRIPAIEKLISHCSESLQEVTALGETVLHLAVKNSQSEALKVVLEKLKGSEYFEKLLKAKDYRGKGKTIVELAQGKKQAHAKKKMQVVEVLREYQNEHSDNDASARSPGNHSESMEVDQQEIDICSETDDDKQESSEKAKEKPRQIEKSSDPETDKKEKEGQVDLANLVLTAAVLIATETYQAGFGPPSTLLKKYELNPRCIFTFKDFLMTISNGGVTQETLQHCPAFYFYYFMMFNTAGFLSSVALILTVMLRYAYTYPTAQLLCLSICWLLYNYITCLISLLENHSKSQLVIVAISGALVIFFCVGAIIIFWFCRSVVKHKLRYVNKCKSWKKEIEKKRDQWYAKMLGFLGKQRDQVSRRQTDG